MKIRGLYAITDKNLIKREEFEKKVEEAILGGADIIQLREKGTPREEIIELGRKLLRVTRKYGVPLIINDDPEIAREIDADGVHVGREDVPVKEARRILGPHKIVGASAYDDVDLAKKLEEEGASYVTFGAVFPSPTKPEEKVIELELLREAKKILEIPVVAIGGINEENLELLMKYGPDAIAVVSAIFGRSDVREAASRLKNIIRRFQDEGKS